MGPASWRVQRAIFQGIALFLAWKCKFCSSVQYCSPRLEPRPQLSSKFLPFVTTPQLLKKNAKKSALGQCRTCCQTTTGASGMDKLLLYHSTTSLSTSRCAWCAGSPNDSNHSHLAGTNATEALRPRSSPEAQLWRIQPCDLAQLRVRVGKCRTRMHIPSKNVRQRYLSHSSSAFAR